jgi:membrane-associated phospholipid phosphatase
MAAMLLPAGALRRLGMVIATLLSLSRNYMRYHHASDVVAGATLGAIVGGLLRRALK